MLNKEKTLYSLSDVAIMPATISNIDHRCECNPYYEDGKLPIFTAPMPCVVDAETYDRFEHYGIHTILPRTENIDYRLSVCNQQWCAFSLNEFKEHFIDEFVSEGNIYALIDVANGNMWRLYEMSRVAKENYRDRLKLMVGNIANPETFRKFCEIKVDYVRCSVGSGNACVTATCLGILYPLASLIDECRKIKMELNSDTKIIADGGISSYRRIIKALALGADYVMLGSMLNKLSDSAGEIFRDGLGKEWKIYYGMASERGMRELGKKGTPEGKEIRNECKGSISEFSQEVTDYIKSAMSYCNIRDITDFIGGPTLNILSTNASNQFNQKR